MSNYTMDCYEMKRDLINYSTKISKGLNKPSSKFVMDMIYGIARAKSCLISEISRGLSENIKLRYTIERLCDNLQNMTDDEVNIIMTNYYNEIKYSFADEPIAIFDDSDIAKRYGKKFEDLDRVIDASSPNKEIVNGYHVCEALLLTKKEKQAVSVYSEIYSCKSDGFKSKNEYTIKSIDSIRNITNRKTNMIFDRGYDNNKIIDYVDKMGITL